MNQVLDGFGTSSGSKITTKGIHLDTCHSSSSHQDDLDWLVGFSELWLYALRSARLALEPTKGAQLGDHVKLYTVIKLHIFI